MAPAKRKRPVVKPQASQSMQTLLFVSVVFIVVVIMYINQYSTETTTAKSKQEAPKPKKEVKASSNSLLDALKNSHAQNLEEAENLYKLAKGAGFKGSDREVLKQFAHHKMQTKDTFLRSFVQGDMETRTALSVCGQVGTMDKSCYGPGSIELFTDAWALENTEECTTLCETVCEFAKSLAGKGHFDYSARSLHKLIEINPKVSKPRHIFGALLPWGMHAKDRFKRLDRPEQERIIKVLSEMVGDKDEEWGHLAALNLASAFYCRGELDDLESARSVLASLVGTKKAIADKPTQARLGELHVITVATQNTPELENLKTSAKRSKVDLKVLGLGQEWTGNQLKIKLFQDYMATVPDDDLVMAIDGYDTLLFSSVNDIKNNFLAFQKDIVFGAESNCFPDVAFKLFFHTNGKRMHRFQYLNAGTWIGRAKPARDMLEEVSTRFPNFLYDDQRALSLYHFGNLETTGLDHRSLIFLTLHGCQVSKDGKSDIKNCNSWFEVQNNYFMSKLWDNQVAEMANNMFKNGTLPAVVHGNGPIGTKALDLVIAKIEKDQIRHDKRNEQAVEGSDTGGENKEGDFRIEL